VLKCAVKNCNCQLLLLSCCCSSQKVLLCGSSQKVTDCLQLHSTALLLCCSSQKVTVSNCTQLHCCCAAAVKRCCCAAVLYCCAVVLFTTKQRPHDLFYHSDFQLEDELGLEGGEMSCAGAHIGAAVTHAALQSVLNAHRRRPQPVDRFRNKDKARE
jgi:hypothetical protein